MQTIATPAFPKTADTFASGAKTLPQKHFVSPEVFEEEEESQSNRPGNNKCEHLLPVSQLAQQLTDSAHDDFAMWQYSINSPMHGRGSKPQSRSAGNVGFKQLTKCTQELLALRRHSVNSTPTSDCNRNLCHCSDPPLIKGTVRSLDSERQTARNLELQLLALRA